MLCKHFRSCSATAAIAAMMIPAFAAAGDVPAWVASPVSRIVYDGVSDDLLTAGLGASGLAGAAPVFADPLDPTVEELRQVAIYNNYRALVDMSPGGGYGRLYGPNVLADGTPTAGEGLIAGVEYIAYLGQGDAGASGQSTRRPNVTAMVQIPDGFDPASPCIVTGPSSGSRGVYGAIATSGEWGLKNGCAVAYTDKGTGTGAHGLADDTVGLIDGTRFPADEAGAMSSFTAQLSDRQRAAFNSEFPNRFAFKHAHSRQNPEADWGLSVLRSIEFAFWALNEEYPGSAITSENTIVIASSISNGGGASVLAAEQDKAGLIDAVVAGEPNVSPVRAEFEIQQGGGEPFTDHGRSLVEYYSILNLYLPCAAASPLLASAPLNFAFSTDRCQGLHELGLLVGATIDEQAAESQAIINEAGFAEEQNILAPSHWFINVPQAIGVTYSNAYARAGVEDNLCDFSFASTDPVSGAPVPLADESEQGLFATSNGIPPTAGINLVDNASATGPILDRLSTSPVTGRADQNLDGYLCLWRLAWGADPVAGSAVTGSELAAHNRIRSSVAKIRAGGDLGGRPAVFVTGRADAILPINHTSRSYLGLNKHVEGEKSRLSYIEVLNAQHLDALNAFPGFDRLYLPLHHYYVQSMDLMLAHLEEGTPLPASQVVRTMPRTADASGAVMPVTEADNLPPIAVVPVPGDAITFDGETLLIPE